MDSERAQKHHWIGILVSTSLALALLVIGWVVIVRPADYGTHPVSILSAVPGILTSPTLTSPQPIASAATPTALLVTVFPGPVASPPPAPTVSPARRVPATPSAPAAQALPSETPDTHITAYAFAGNDIWVAVHNTLLHTTDEGQHWVPQIALNVGSMWEVPLVFVDARHGWIVTDGYVQATTDGGQHWVKQYPVAAYSVSLSFVSIRQGWIVLDRKLLATSDGGQTWRLVVSNYPVANVWFFDALHGWSFHNEAVPNPEFYHSDDGGKTWAARPLPACRWYKVRGQFTASGARTAWVACGPDIGSSALASADLYRSTDAGQSWSRIASIANARNDPNLLWVGRPFFLDDQYGWVGLCCASEDAHQELLYRTTDGGRSWASSARGFDDMRFASLTRGYAVAGATLLGTRDGGLHWSVLYSPSSVRGSP
jgi:photosystem II stability/assembly factor-like uncharacterized protein